MSQEAPYPRGGSKALVFQPGGGGAEFPGDLLTLLLRGHFLVLGLVQLVLGKCTQAQACTEPQGQGSQSQTLLGHMSWGRWVSQPTHLRLKDKSFQAVGSLLPFLLLQVSGCQVFKSVGSKHEGESTVNSDPGADSSPSQECHCSAPPPRTQHAHGHARALLTFALSGPAHPRASQAGPEPPAPPQSPLPLSVSGQASASFLPLGPEEQPQTLPPFSHLASSGERDESVRKSSGPLTPHGQASIPVASGLPGPRAFPRFLFLWPFLPQELHPLSAQRAGAERYPPSGPPPPP